MTFIQRAIKYLYRKKARSLLLLIIMMAITLAILGTVSVQKATGISQKEIKRSLNTHFTLTPNPAVSFGIGSRGFGDLPEESIQKIAKTEGISDYQVSLIAEGSLDKMQKIELKNPQLQYNAEEEAILKKHFDFEGNRNTSLDHKFLSGLLKLKEGRHLNEKDQYKILVHEDFAKKNNLKLHDSLNFASSPINEFTQAAQGKVEVVGIFTGSNQEKASHSEELFENMILSDLQTAKELRGYGETEAMYAKADFFLADPEEMESVLEKVQALDLPWERYQMTEAKQNYAGMITSISSMNRIVQQMFLGILLISILILTLILWFWLNARVHETGILLSMGLSKINIIGQYFVEVILIGALAFLLSLPLSHQISEKLSQTVVEQAQEKTHRIQQNDLGGLNMGSDANSSVGMQTIEKLDVKISAEEVLKVLALGSLLIFVSVSSASFYIVRLTPKEILSKMS